MSPSMEFSSHGGVLLKIQPDFSTQTLQVSSGLTQKIFIKLNRIKPTLNYYLTYGFIEPWEHTVEHQKQENRNLPKPPLFLKNSAMLISFFSPLENEVMHHYSGSTSHNSHESFKSFRNRQPVMRQLT